MRERGGEGLVTNIQRFSIHDGPGIRTTVFLKGCNLHCFWCHNPEDIRPAAELQFFPERCIACAGCVDVCSQDAHRFLDDGCHLFLRDRCDACGACIDTCYAKALVLVGSRTTAAEVLAEIMQDQAFYTASGGGVTISGGEPLLQFDFSHAVLARCRELGIHTAIETAANFAWARMAAILPVTDLVMMDIKHMDSELHRRSTGAPNQRILSNALRLGRESQPLIIRTPIVPGVNDNVEQVKALLPSSLNCLTCSTMNCCPTIRWLRASTGALTWLIKPRSWSLQAARRWPSWLPLPRRRESEFAQVEEKKARDDACLGNVAVTV